MARVATFAPYTKRDATLPVLGIDPGKDSGSLVLLTSSGRAVLAWWAYTRLDRVGGDVYRLRSSMREESTHPSLHRVALMVGVDLEPYLGERRELTLCVEGLFVPRRDGKLSLDDQLTLAEACGELVGPLRGYVVGPVPRPKAGTWRPQVASIPAGTEAREAERMAIERAAVAFSWPGARFSELTPVEQGSVSESAFIAKYGERYATG